MVYVVLVVEAHLEQSLVNYETKKDCNTYLNLSHYDIFMKYNYA